MKFFFILKLIFNKIINLHRIIELTQKLLNFHNNKWRNQFVNEIWLSKGLSRRHINMCHHFKNFLFQFSGAQWKLSVS